MSTVSKSLDQYFVSGLLGLPCVVTTQYLFFTIFFSVAARGSGKYLSFSCRDQAWLTTSYVRGIIIIIRIRESAKYVRGIFFF